MTKPLYRIQRLGECMLRSVEAVPLTVTYLHVEVRQFVSFKLDV